MTLQSRTYPVCAGALLLGMALSAGPSFADVIVPGVREATQRMHKHPNLFDRTDQFCQGKATGEACTVPGLGKKNGVRFI